MRDKDILYIIIHIHKTGGTTLKSHIRFNFKKEEILLLYRNINPDFVKKDGVENYINSLPLEKREKIKVIIGHGAYWGLHELFQKPCRYVIFFRNPVGQVISSYNGNYMVLKLNNSQSNEDIIKNLEFYFKNHNRVFRFLARRLLGENGYSALTPVNLERIKDILNKFYFVGLTENPQDFMFIYNQLKIKKFFFYSTYQ